MFGVMLCDKTQNIVILMHFGLTIVFNMCLFVKLHLKCIHTYMPYFRLKIQYSY